MRAQRQREYCTVLYSALNQLFILNRRSILKDPCPVHNAVYSGQSGGLEHDFLCNNIHGCPPTQYIL